MKVLVRCARRVQVAYFTLYHRGCKLVSPSTWAKGVPRVAPCRRGRGMNGNCTAQNEAWRFKQSYFNATAKAGTHKAFLFHL